MSKAKIIQFDKEYKKKKIRNKVNELIKLNPDQRIDYILKSPDADQIIKAMNVQDLYYTIMQVGKEDCSELIAYSSSEQFKGFIDLDSWKKDRINIKSVLGWLQIVREGGDYYNLFRMMDSLDFTLILFVLKHYLQIFSLRDFSEAGLDVPKDLETIDSLYGIRYNCEPEQYEIIKQYLNRLFSLNSELFLNLMEGLNFEFNSNLEEKCYKARLSRLEDNGFVDFYDALELFAYYDPINLEKDQVQNNLFNESNSTEQQKKVSLILWHENSDSDNRLSALFEDLDEQTFEILSDQFAWVINAVMSAKRIDFSEFNEVVDAASMVSDYLYMGIDYLARNRKGTNISKLFVKYGPKNLFRCGYSLTLKLRNKAKNIISRWGLYDNGKYILVDSRDNQILEGMLKKIPQYYEGIKDTNSTEFRNFRDLTEIDEVSNILDNIDLQAKLLCNVFGFSLEKFYSEQKTEIDICNISPGMIFNTVMSNIVLKSDNYFKPILRPIIPELLNNLVKKKKQGKAEFKKINVNKIKKMVSNSTMISKSDKNKIIQQTMDLINKFESEFSLISEHDLDYRYISEILLLNGNK